MYQLDKKNTIYYTSVGTFKYNMMDNIILNKWKHINKKCDKIDIYFYLNRKLKNV